MTDPRDPATRLRSLERRLRRDKRALERINPVERAEAYTAALEGVMDLEAGRRTLRATVADDPDPADLLEDVVDAGGDDGDEEDEEDEEDEDGPGWAEPGP